MTSFTVPSHLTLYVYVEDNTFRKVYMDAANKHNDKVCNTSYPDAGFDLFLPFRISAKDNILLDYDVSAKPFLPDGFCDMKVKAAMYEGVQPVGYYMYPRSSISKTPLRLANSIGIIDSGYRGNLGAKFDVKPGCVEEWVSNEYHRLLQICSGTLKPFRVVIVDSVEQLNKYGDTERGEGGFGSTGK
jgi:dUTPase